MSVRILYLPITIALLGAILGLVHDDSYAADNVSWDEVTQVTVSSAYQPLGNRESWHHDNCVEGRAIVERYGTKDMQDICVTYSPNASLASFSPYGGQQLFALKKNTDSAYHLLSNVHYPAAPVLLSNDTLLTANVSSESDVLQFFAISDIQGKLTETSTQNSQTEYSKIYVVDVGQGEVVRDGEGRPLSVSEIAASTNNKYAVAAVYGEGIAVVDLQAKRAKLITSDTVYSPDLGIQLAVSNDGKRIVVAGQSTLREKVYLIDENCGEVNFYTAAKIDRPCVEIDFSSQLYNAVGGIETYFVEMSSIKDEITLYQWDEGNSSKYQTTVKPDPNSMRLAYLALGDSYASGEGDTEKNPSGGKYYREYTNNEEDKDQKRPREKCHVSTRSYPYILAQGMNLGGPVASPATKWQTVACSGAQKYDISNTSADYLGQGKGGSEGGKPRLDGYLTAKQLQATALNEFIPGREKQIEFVKRYRPKAITLTMGGNDVGFADKIENCVMSITTCEFAQVENRQKLKNELRDEYASLVSMYRMLHAASGGQSKIYVLGYPQFINNEGNATCKNIYNLDDNERKMIYNSVSYYNDVIEQAAKFSGVKYIDIEQSLQSHRLCDSGEKYVTAITNILGLNGNERQEGFHPNSKGHGAIANAVKSKLSNQSLLDYNPCPAPWIGPQLCPDITATQDEILTPTGGYFEEGIPTKAKFKKIDVTAGQAKKGQSLDLKLENYFGLPGTYFSVVLHSEPIYVGDLLVNSEGAVAGSITIPPSTPAGYHTLVLSGQTFSGESVEYYQNILVTGGDATDIDENGKPDSQQPCGPFIILANLDSDRDGIDDACDPEVNGVLTETPTPVTPNPLHQLIARIVNVVKSIITSIQKLLVWRF